MTTSSSFDTNEDGQDENTGQREGSGENDWERDVVGDVIEEDDETLYVLVDQEFDDGVIKSDRSVRLDRVE